MHPGGFEPPTARFVAEYSIQLSYGCIRELLSEIIMVHPGGFEPPTARFVAEYSIQLSYGCIRVLLSEIVNGASGRIRTSDRSVRSRVLYPAELRMQNGGEAGIRTPDAAFDRILP